MSLKGGRAQTATKYALDHKIKNPKFKKSMHYDKIILTMENKI